MVGAEIELGPQKHVYLGSFYFFKHYLTTFISTHLRTHIMTLAKTASYEARKKRVVFAFSLYTNILRLRVTL